MNRHRNFHVWGLLKIAGWLFFAVVILLLIVIPVATSLTFKYSGGLPLGSLKYLNYIEQAQRVLMQAFAAVWFFVLGSCFASFLNVVAWRLPQGRSILGSSYCPTCNGKLSFRDNLPIVGWLRNEGQCSLCGVEIPIRYLWVEVILGSVFLLFALATLSTGGATLPIREPNSGWGFERVLFDPKWDLIGILSWHLTLLLFLFTFALVELQRQRIPVSVFAIGALVGISVPFFFTDVQLVHPRWPLTQEFPLVPFSIDQPIYMLFGTLAGTAVGIWATNLKKTPYVLFAFMLVGLFLGWQSVVAVFVLFFLLRIARSMPPNTAAMAATILHLLTWRWFNLVSLQ